MAHRGRMAVPDPGTRPSPYAGVGMRRRVALGALLLIALYVGYQYLRVRRILAAADLPPIPLDVELRYGDSGVAEDPYTIVVIGDSTAQGIGADSPRETCAARVAEALAQDGRSIHLLNLGVTGATVSDVLSSQLPRVAQLSPDLVLLSVGANDVTSWSPTDNYLREMRTILDRLEATGAHVVMLDVPAIVAAPLLPLPLRLAFDARTHRYNEGLRALVRGREQVTLAPIYEGARPAFERDKTHFAADLYHPSSKGYALWAEVVLAALQGADSPADRPPQSQPTAVVLTARLRTTTAAGKSIKLGR